MSEGHQQNLLCMQIKNTSDAFRNLWMVLYFGFDAMQRKTSSKDTLIVTIPTCLKPKSAG